MLQNCCLEQDIIPKLLVSNRMLSVQHRSGDCHNGILKFYFLQLLVMLEIFMNNNTNNGCNAKQYLRDLKVSLLSQGGGPVFTIWPTMHTDIRRQAPGPLEQRGESLQEEAGKIRSHSALDPTQEPLGMTLAYC